MGSKRLKQTPAIPTIGEAGFPEMGQLDWGAWNALLVPIKTPPPVVDKLNDTIRKAAATPAFRDRLEKLAQDPINGERSASEAQDYVQQQIAAWRTVIQKAGIKAP